MILIFSFIAFSDFHLPTRDTTTAKTDPCESRCSLDEYCKADTGECIKYRKEDETCVDNDHRYVCAPGLRCRILHHLLPGLGICDVIISDRFQSISSQKCHEGAYPIEIPTHLRLHGERLECPNFSRCAEMCLFMEQCNLIVLAHGDISFDSHLLQSRNSKSAYTGRLYHSFGELTCTYGMRSISYVRYIDPRVFSIEVSMASTDDRAYESGIYRRNEETEKDGLPFYEKPCIANGKVDTCEIRFRSDLRGWMISGPNGEEVNSIHSEGVPRANWSSIHLLSQHTGPVTMEIEKTATESESIWADKDWIRTWILFLFAAALFSLICFLCGINQCLQGSRREKLLEALDSVSYESSNSKGESLRTSATYSPSSSIDSDRGGTLLDVHKRSNDRGGAPLDIYRRRNDIGGAPLDMYTP